MGELFCRGKKLRLSITSIYVEDDLIAKKVGTVQSHDDVPDNIREDLYMEERHRLESQQSKNNKMTIQSSPHPESLNSIAIPALLLSQNGLSSDDFNIPGLRDEAVREYTGLLEANVGDDDL